MTDPCAHALSFLDTTSEPTERELLDAYLGILSAGVDERALGRVDLTALGERPFGLARVVTTAHSQYDLALSILAPAYEQLTGEAKGRFETKRREGLEILRLVQFEKAKRERQEAEARSRPRRRFPETGDYVMDGRGEVHRVLEVIHPSGDVKIRRKGGVGKLPRGKYAMEVSALPDGAMYGVHAVVNRMAAMIERVFSDGRVFAQGVAWGPGTYSLAVPSLPSGLAPGVKVRTDQNASWKVRRVYANGQIELETGNLFHGALFPHEYAVEP
jgi:hypothetical protein